jgi:hyperosmotically inducible protein
MLIKSFFAPGYQETKRFAGFGPVFVLLLFLVVFSSSCTTPGGRSAGVVYDDALISTRVKSRLTEMLGGQVIGIDVDVYQGEVTLQGRVRSPNMESRVIAVTAQVQGVRKVINLLKIIP